MSFAKLWATKSPQTLIDETVRPDRLMKRTLSAFDLIAFGIGATIGSGIFALTGTASAGQAVVTRTWFNTPIINFILGASLGREGAGPALAVSFVIAAIACLLAALCYAELAAMIPVSGSAYTFAYAALGEIAAWTIGWDLILEYAVGNIAVAVSWSDYFLHFLHGLTGIKLPLWLTCDTHTAIYRLSTMTPVQRGLYSNLSLPSVFGHPLSLNVPALSIVALVTVVLVIGIQESAIVNKIMVFTKVSVVLLFIVLGSGYVHPSNWVPFAPHGLAGIMGGAALVFFSYIGFDAVSSIAEEAKNPQRDMPIAMLGCLAICTLLYATTSLVMTGILPYTSYAGDASPVATALAHIGNRWAEIVVTAGALAGMTSVLLVFQLGQPRIFMAMARDHLLPRIFSRLHPRFRTPFIPTILTGAVVAVSAMFLDIGQAAELTNIGTLAAFILVCGGVIALRKTDPDRMRPFRCPLVPLLPLAGIATCFVLMLSLPSITWVRFLAWMAVGTAVYFLYGYRHNTGWTNGEPQPGKIDGGITEGAIDSPTGPPQE